MKYSLEKISPFQIIVKDSNNRVPIKFIQPQMSYTLVEVSVNPSYYLSNILPIFYEKIS
jgi:hypothetical protein